MKKIVAVIVAVVVLLSSMSLLASADTGEHLTLKKVEIYDVNKDDWVDMTDYASWTVRTGGGMNLIVDHPETDDFSYRGIKATWQPGGYIRLKQGQYFKINMSFTDSYSSASWLPDQLDTGEFYFVIQTSDGGVYSLYPYSYYNEADENGVLNWDISFASHIYGDEIYIRSIGFRSNWPSYNNGLDPYSISVFTSITTELTPEMEQHQELITKIDANTEAIVGAIKDQTDTITNGWGTGDDSAGKADSVTDNMANAENAALGGKNDAQIKNDVSGALNYNMPSESLTGAIQVANTFDQLLNAFGSKYQSVLILALTLGLAAFLVGKSYRAKGD